MRVRIGTLPYEGKTITARLDRELLNKRLKEGRQAEVEALTDPEFQVVVTPHPAGAWLRGSVSCSVSQVCGRCGEAAEHMLRADLDWSLRPFGDGVTRDDQDDLGIYSYSDDHFDLEEALYEALVLQVSPIWRPDLPGNERSSHRCPQSYSVEDPVREPCQAPRTESKLLQALQRAGLKSTY
jgi:uncharacterized metal-binding protein YceD (DUF177 family)